MRGRESEEEEEEEEEDEEKNDEKTGLHSHSSPSSSLFSPSPPPPPLCSPSFYHSSSSSPPYPSHAEAHLSEIASLCLEHGPKLQSGGTSFITPATHLLEAVKHALESELHLKTPLSWRIPRHEAVALLAFLLHPLSLPAAGIFSDASQLLAASYNATPASAAELFDLLRPHYPDEHSADRAVKDLRPPRDQSALNALLDLHNHEYLNEGVRSTLLSIPREAIVKHLPPSQRLEQHKVKRRSCAHEQRGSEIVFSFVLTLQLSPTLSPPNPQSPTFCTATQRTRSVPGEADGPGQAITGTCNRKENPQERES